MWTHSQLLPSHFPTTTHSALLQPFSSITSISISSTNCGINSCNLSSHVPLPHFSYHPHFTASTPKHFSISNHIAHTKSKPIPQNEIHARTRLYNLYLQMYVNAGAMQEARNLFDEMPERSLVSWTIVMSGYARYGPPSEVLVMFWDMLCCSGGGLLRPDSFVFAVVLRACGLVESLSYGRGVHGLVLKQSSVVDSFVENALVSMYASCGALEDAAVVSSVIDKPDLVGWSSMLSGYMKNGLEEEGLRIFCDMISGGIEPDAFAFSTVLGACTNLEYWDFGTQIHCYIIKMGSKFIGTQIILENNLMDFYAKCRDLDGMRQVFSYMSEKNSVSWNTFTNGYVHNFHYLEALRIFQILMEEVSQCDDFSLISILKAVTGLGYLDHGKEIHGYILRAGIETNGYVVSSLLDIYIGCIDNESLYPRDEVPLKLLDNLEMGEYDEFIMASLLKMVLFGI